jgi:hypothetical protein
LKDEIGRCCTDIRHVEETTLSVTVRSPCSSHSLCRARARALDKLTMATTTAYPTPICLSSATSSAKDLSSSILLRCSFKTAKRNPFLLFSAVSVGGSHLSDSAVKRRRQRRRRSGSAKVSCSSSHGRKLSLNILQF